MPNSTLLTAFALGLCVFIFLVCHSSTRHKSRRLPLPPGPKASWFGGTQLTTSHPWLTYTQWKDTFGDVVYIYQFGNPIVVLNTVEAADLLLDKRSNKYSSRPRRTMLHDLMGWDWALSVMPYGPRWRRHRTKFKNYFHFNLSSVYRPIQIQETHTLLRNLLTTPNDFYDHIRRSATAIILNITCGYTVAERDDPCVALADAAMQTMSKAGVFGTYLVDYIPALKYVPLWMPGASFKRQAREWRCLSREMLDSPFMAVKENMAKGTAVACITTKELEKLKEYGGSADDEDVIKNVIAIAYGGGADTTVSAIASFMLAMVLYPDIQKKAQDDIDRITSGDRLPTFADQTALPYISCVVWECLRWNPVTPMAVPHCVTEDDEYNGYRIPKGSTILANVWAILHDENKYPEPFRFSPERFEHQEENKLAGINDLPQSAFGFGRRMCPGRWLAHDSIWIAVASVLSVYNISAAVDDKGLPILPSVEYSSGTISHPKPFECRIIPRSDAAASLIKQTADVKA